MYVNYAIWGGGLYGPEDNFSRWVGSTQRKGTNLGGSESDSAM